MTRAPLVLATCLSAVVCAAAGEPADQGHLVLNGGGTKPAEVMATFVELAGGQEASIVVFPTASEDSGTGADSLNLLKNDYGCRNVSVAAVEGRDDAEDEAMAARVAAATGIWFAGGDQRRITTALLGTQVGEAVKRAFHLGAVVGGTSAGTACQSGLMITGDGDFTVIASDNVELWPGLGLFHGVIVDQHFVARRRQNRLISVVLEHPELLGVGVDEDTAVWVRPDGSFKVLGHGWVVVYDAAAAKVRHHSRDASGDALGVHGMTMHVLLPGDVFDVSSKTVLAEDPWPGR